MSSSLRRNRAPIAVLTLTLLLAAAACTADPSPDDPPPADASSDGLISQDSSDTPFVPGSFIYRFNSITAQATFDGNMANLSIRNDSGAELGSPSLYVIGADDRRYDGLAEAASPIADGEQATLQVAFPERVNERTIGLVVLSFGELNVGAMAPVPVSGS